MLNIYIFSPEVLVPAQTDAQFEIDEYFQVPFLPKRFPCCVLSYFSLVIVVEHSRRW